MIRAAIAIGSNSTRLLVAEKQGNELKNSYRGREETRLFLGLDEKGCIARERLELTAQAVARMAMQARERGAEEIALFATSATRDAKNGHELGARIRALCGLSLQIITGEEEARLAFCAVAGKERCLVMDIGGGSTEFTWGEAGQIAYAASAQMGASRLLKMCDIENERDAERALDLARAALMPFASQLEKYPHGKKLIGLGGSCTTAAGIAIGRTVHGEDAEGLKVTLEEARCQLSRLSRLPLEERKKVAGLPPERAVHMPHGLSILVSAMELCGYEEMTVSGKNNLDGFLLTTK
ncbi:MAG: hypothetical protein E7329_10325 [Clostridiales bacterium]|nr:hypothetical protein [Clostridiales bacterium]